MKVIDYEQYRKRILVAQAIENEIDLIYNVKSYFPELRVRISLDELAIVNDIVYEMLKKDNHSFLLFEYMDKIISNALYYSMDTEKLDMEKILYSFQICTFSDILNISQVKQIKLQINEEMTEMKKKNKLVEIRCKNGKTKF